MQRPRRLVIGVDLFENAQPPRSSLRGIRIEVSRIRVGPTGAMAWISCRRVLPSPTPRISRVCRSPRHGRTVYLLPPNPNPDPQYGRLSTPKTAALIHAKRRSSSSHATTAEAAKYGFDRAHGPTDVSSLRASRDGSITWISCRIQSNDAPTPLLAHACRSPRRKHTLYVLPMPSDPNDGANGPRLPTALDSGHGIDPFSLAISSTRVTWRRNGHAHSARIPPPGPRRPPRPQT